MFPLSTAWWLPRLAGTDADLVQAIHQFWTAPTDRPVPPPIVRGWAVAQAYRAGDARALDWLLQRPPLPDERPFVRHALARSRRWAAARGLLPAGPTDLREQLEAELHLGLFTEAGLARAAKTYERLLADPSVPDERKDLMREQVEAVRTALTGSPATSDRGSPGGRRRRPGR